MIIKKKIDSQTFAKQFDSYSELDHINNKRYLVFNDKERDGIITLMSYPDGTFTYHSKGEYYCDKQETIIDEIQQYIWNNRKEINRKLKAINDWIL